jgi:hypothetical protein
MALAMALALPLWQQTGSRMWELMGADSGAQPMLRIGRHNIRFGDIKSYAITDDVEHDKTGILILGCWFVFGAVCFAAGVLHNGRLTEFLLGAAFFFVAGTAALTESAFASTYPVQRLTINLRDGRSVSLTSADRADFGALVVTLTTAKA